MPIIEEAQLHAQYRELATALGADEAEAEIFARCYVRADLRGLFTAGAAVVPYIISLIQHDLMRFGAPFEVVRDAPASALVDGGHGVGSVVATRAMDLAIDKARAAGVGCVWIAHGGDFGLASNHALQAIEQGLVGIAMRNGTPRVAPWGGRDGFFGTDPISVGIPAGERDPIVIDMSAGSFSVGRTVMAARDGRRMPSAHLVDAEGRYTDDPASIVADPADRESGLNGALVTLGHKGFAWQLIVELLAGLLSGMGTSNQNDYWPTPERRWREGSFVMAIDVEHLLPVADFLASVDGLIDALKAVRPAQGFDEVRVPGEAAAATERERRSNGIPIRDEDWDAIQRVAQELGLRTPSA
ncbi:MAG: Ldh family oxidoreductase [Solirubrobacteraceae bacterium]